MSEKKLKGVSTMAPLSLEPAGWTERFKVWMERHSNHVAVSVLALLLILGGLWGMDAYSKSKEKRASAAYAELSREWPPEGVADPKAWEKVISSLEKFVQEHRGTPPALDAQLDLALASFHARRYEDALKWQNKVLADAPAGHSLRLFAGYQMALTYETMGKTDEAIARWTDLQSQGSLGLQREIDWRLGRLYAGKNEYSKAVAHYEKALQMTGTYPNPALLQAELSDLRLKAGAKGEAPKAEAPGDKS